MVGYLLFNPPTFFCLGVGTENTYTLIIVNYIISGVWFLSFFLNDRLRDALILATKSKVGNLFSYYYILIPGSGETAFPTA
jgi:hypothetical protein